MLETELESVLGYSKYDYSSEETDNNRNGYSKKKVVSSMGEIGLDSPRGLHKINYTLKAEHILNKKI